MRSILHANQREVSMSDDLACWAIRLLCTASTIAIAYAMSIRSGSIAKSKHKTQQFLMNCAGCSDWGAHKVHLRLCASAHLNGAMQKRLLHF